MPNHPAIAPGRVAVITGGAGGIGLAAAKRFAALGMKVVHRRPRPGGARRGGGGDRGGVAGRQGRGARRRTDVSRMEEVQALKATRLCRRSARSPC